jgi:pimeloyl-ACP methyl ester carboxylesterase
MPSAPGCDRAPEQAGSVASVALEPKLIDVAVPDRPAGAVLVLHGGAARRENAMVSPTQLSVLRMVPIARRIARAGKGRLAVFRLLNSRRGWDTTHTPVRDASWAMDAMADRLGDAVPVCLAGHSLGGRAALLAAGRPEVRGVVALAPWVYATDAPRGLSGDERILIVHGDRDRVASPERARAVADRLGAEFVVVEGGRHAMLAHHGTFSGLAAQWCVATLLTGARVLAA